MESLLEPKKGKTRKNALFLNVRATKRLCDFVLTEVAYVFVYFLDENHV